MPDRYPDGPQARMTTLRAKKRPKRLHTCVPRRCEEDTRMDPVQVVQEFIDAFNARDVDRVVGCFSADAVMQNDAGTCLRPGRGGNQGALWRVPSPKPQPPLRNTLSHPRRLLGGARGARDRPRSRGACARVLHPFCLPRGGRQDRQVHRVAIGSRSEQGTSRRRVCKHRTNERRTRPAQLGATHEEAGFV